MYLLDSDQMILLERGADAHPQYATVLERGQIIASDAILCVWEEYRAMAQTVMSDEEVTRRGEELYKQTIRAKVETDSNIGKMVIIDVETADYEVDEMGLESSRLLHAKRPNAELYGIRIGYKSAEVLGGVLERVTT